MKRQLLRSGSGHHLKGVYQTGLLRSVTDFIDAALVSTDYIRLYEKVF
jgi:hypothetical protein